MIIPNLTNEQLKFLLYGLCSESYEEKEFLTDDQQRKALTDILKHLRFDSMKEAKNVLECLLFIDSHIPNVVYFNDLLHHCHRDNLSYGWAWGWKDLNWDVLSNKYGAAALRDTKKKKTYFTLRLPPVVKL